MSRATGLPFTVHLISMIPRISGEVLPSAYTICGIERSTSTVYDPTGDLVTCNRCRKSLRWNGTILRNKQVTHG